MIVEMMIGGRRVVRRCSEFLAKSSSLVEQQEHELFGVQYLYVFRFLAGIHSTSRDSTEASQASQCSHVIKSLSIDRGAMRTED
jgi:hypothetical protein